MSAIPDDVLSAYQRQCGGDDRLSSRALSSLIPLMVSTAITRKMCIS
jgi:hypothetical protein